MFEQLNVGGKLELEYKTTKVKQDDAPRVCYSSQIMDFLDDAILCTMPIQEGKIVPLEVNSVMEVFFYAGKSMYKADCTIIARGKEGNIYTMTLRPDTKLEKFQRRAFFRLDCTIEVAMKLLEPGEVAFLEKNERLPEKLQGTEERGVIIDISGGGLRVFARKAYNRNDIVCFRFMIEVNGDAKVVTVPGRIIMAPQSPNNPQVYDNRVQFVHVTKEQTEEIVKYIFEQQRLLRKKERG